MPHIHAGGNKAAWERLNRDQDLRSLNAHPEALEFEEELLES